MLPLKGRHLFTMRFLWHADQQKMPYKFIIADADPHCVVKDAIDKKVFSNLDITYHIFPPDNTFGDFYNKLASAAEFIKTPYVMQVDNDDFLIPSGLENCMSWLEKHEDYVACSGLIMSMGFEKLPQAVVGSPFKFAAQYNVACDIDSELPLRRTMDAGVGKIGFYYTVLRSEAYLHISKTIRRISPTYLLFYEILFELGLLSLGKVKIDSGFCSYIRQTNTSMSSHYVSLDHFLESDIGSDSQKIKNYLIDQCGVQNDEDGKTEINNFIKNWLINVKLKYFFEKINKVDTVSVVKSFSPVFVIKLFRLIYRAKYNLTYKWSNFGRIEDATENYNIIFEKEICEICNSLASKELFDFLTDSFESSPEIIEELSVQKPDIQS